MIDTHQFNSDWYGQPVGIIRTPAFFTQTRSDMQRALDSFAWVEFRCKPDEVNRQELSDHGFFLADTQIHFRLNLKVLQPTESLKRLETRWADAHAFLISSTSMAPFQFERYRHLPNMNAERLNNRYSQWAATLIRDAKETCLEVTMLGEPQGWFLTNRPGAKLQLTLAMTSSNAKISGFHLYLKACVAFAARGFSIGEAAFSVHNLPVLNIYSQLGARFVSTEDCWLRLPTTV